MSRKQLGLFGYGRLGRLLAQHLAPDFELLIHDPARPGPEEDGFPLVSAREAGSCEVVVLAVPISAMEAVCGQLASLMHPGQLLLDTCSVKLQPLQVLRQLLPAGVEVIGTHPLFGPDSARGGLTGHKVVLCPLSEGKVAAVKGYLEGKGLRVLTTTPEAHDRAMAETQCLFHLMARAIQEMDIRIGDIATPGPEKLYRDFSILQQDSMQLFIDMQNLNSFAGPLRREFIRVLQRIDSALGESD